MRQGVDQRLRHTVRADFVVLRAAFIDERKHRDRSRLGIVPPRRERESRDAEAHDDRGDGDAPWPAPTRRSGRGSRGAKRRQRGVQFYSAAIALRG